MDIALINLGKLVAGCWVCAENETAKMIAREQPAPDEELITKLLIGKLRVIVDQASKEHKVQRAFLADLRRSIDAYKFDLARLASGLVARVNLHNRQHEGKLSAADLGIVVRRPLVRLENHCTRIEFRPDHATGLLAQAKVGHSTDSTKTQYRWGRLQAKQQHLFPTRRDYSALLLYRVHTCDGGSTLERLGWQLCKGHAIEEVKHWLLRNTFPQEVTSSDVIQQLFANRIGMQDRTLIQSIIDPKASYPRIIDIEIYWEDGRTPPPAVESRQRKTMNVRQLVQH